MNPGKLRTLQQEAKPREAETSKQTFNIPSSSLNKRSNHRRINTIRHLVPDIITQDIIVFGEYFNGGEVGIEEVGRP